MRGGLGMILRSISFPEPKYDFLVPLNEKWNDASIQSDADGYPSPPALKWFERFRRVSDERYFKLIGAIDFDLRDPIRIGTKLSNFGPARSGRLYCFANDLRIMYWNNCGSIEVNVTRTA
jgi:hypothetical protein